MIEVNERYDMNSHELKEIKHKPVHKKLKQVYD